MTRLTEFVLMGSILILGIMAVSYVANNSYQHINIVCQEGC